MHEGKGRARHLGVAFQPGCEALGKLRLSRSERTFQAHDVPKAQQTADILAERNHFRLGATDRAFLREKTGW